MFMANLNHHLYILVFYFLNILNFCKKILFPVTINLQFLQILKIKEYFVFRLFPQPIFQID